MGLFSPIWVLVGIMVLIILLVKFWEIWLVIIASFIGLMVLSFIIGFISDLTKPK